MTVAHDSHRTARSGAGPAHGVGTGTRRARASRRHAGRGGDLRPAATVDVAARARRPSWIRVTWPAIRSCSSCAVGSAITTRLRRSRPDGVRLADQSLWFWFTVLFANLAESVAEGRGKAQAASLRAVKRDTIAHRVGHRRARVEEVAGSALRPGDRVVVTAGETIPGDGDIVDGIATVDESAITGESAPVVRESGGDRSRVTGGTTVLSDRIVVEITAAPGESFVDRMIALVEGAARQKTPNEIALNILLAALTIVFLLTVVALGPMVRLRGRRPQSRSC